MSAEGLRNSLLALSLVVSLGSVLFTALTVRADHERRRRQFTIEVIMRWDTMTREARERLEAIAHPYFGEARVLPMPEPRKHTVGQQRESEPDIKGSHPSVLEDARTVLNYMNWVAIAVALDVVDEHTVKCDLGAPFRRWHEFLRDYRESYIGRLVKKGDPWKDLESVLDRWFPDVQAQEKRPIWELGRRRKF